MSSCDIPLTVAASPHIRSRESVARIMWQVNLALAPATLFGILNFGFPAFRTILVSILGAMVSEGIAQYWQKKSITLKDGSAFLTGLLLALSLPPGLPWYIPLLGSAVAIGIAKHLMGGLGGNVFNPAHVGRAFLLASYPAAMTSFSLSNIQFDVQTRAFSFVKNITNLDGVTSATPLGILKQEGYARLVENFDGITNLYSKLIIGNHAGSIGETSTILLLLGGGYLAFRGYIKLQTPLTMILTVAIISWVFGGASGLFTGDPLFHCMAGGLVLGAFFMATDPVTIPISAKGQIIFALGAGCLTMLIRLVGGYPEGVCYAILLMNAVTPIIDKFVFPEKFGRMRKKI